MSTNRTLKYLPPKDSFGKPYWVPVVAKNKDFLIGFLDGMHVALDMNDLSLSDLTIALGSDRLNDILPDGRRISKISQKEFKKHLKDVLLRNKELAILSESNDDFNPDILRDYFLTIDCQCGNFYGFEFPSDLPSTSFDCDMCKKRLIDYTDHDDDDYVYDGDPGDVDGLVQEITKELNDECDDIDDEEM